MIFRRLVLGALAPALFLGAGVCANERLDEGNNPSSYGQRDPYDLRMQRRPLGPWDMHRINSRLGHRRGMAARSKLRGVFRSSASPEQGRHIT